MNPTTTHSSETVGQLVLIEADPIRERVRHAIAGFLAWIHRVGGVGEVGASTKKAS